MRNKRWMQVTIRFILLSMLVVPVSLADEATTASKFMIGDAPPSGLSISAPATMTPQVDTTISVGVSDSDGMGDVNLIRIVFFYTDLPDGTVPGGADPQTCAFLTWTRGGSPEWDISAGTDGSSPWSINEGTKPADDDTTGTWVFSFKPGAVATQTVSGNSRWRIYASVTTADAGPVDGYYGGEVQMNWYGEIAVNTALVDWGSVDKGSDFEANKVTGVSVTYIANGDYDGQIKSAATWTGASLDPGGNCGNPSEFALKANDEDGYGGGPHGAHLVGTSRLTIYDAGEQTGVNGYELNTNTLWLKVAADFDKGAFEGTITYIIVVAS